MNCAGCNTESKTTFTREMKIGAKGGMGQSFDRSYELCEACLQLCRESGALLNLQTLRANGDKRPPRARVAARTLQWLKAAKVA